MIGNLAFFKAAFKASLNQATNAGLAATNQGVNSFEKAFQDAFVKELQKNQDLHVESYNATKEAETGADVNITWTFGDKTFRILLQIKVLYKSYEHYMNTLDFAKQKKDPSAPKLPREEKWKDCKDGYFDTQYPSKLSHKSQLLTMHDYVKDPGDKVQPGFLLLPSPQAGWTGNIAQSAYVLPLWTIESRLTGIYVSPFRGGRPDLDQEILDRLSGADLNATLKDLSPVETLLNWVDW